MFSSILVYKSKHMDTKKKRKKEKRKEKKKRQEKTRKDKKRQEKTRKNWNAYYIGNLAKKTGHLLWLAK